MNSLLMKHRPKDVAPEKWKEQWENLAPSLQPLADVINEMKQGLEYIDPRDFGDANHYQKLVASLIAKQTLERVLSFLPSRVQK